MNPSSPTKPPAGQKIHVPVSQLLRYARPAKHDFAEAARKEVTKRRGREPTCKAGCAFCCYAKVLVDPYTGAIIHLHLKAEGRWTPEMRAKLAAADREMTPVSHADWLPKRIPCVFLKEEKFGHGKCTVYSARPIPCAATFSTADDPADCAVPGGQALQLVNADPEILRNHVLPGFDDLQEIMGIYKTLRMTLPGAVLWAGALMESALFLPYVFQLEANNHTDAQEPDEVFDRLAARAFQNATVGASGKP